MRRAAVGVILAGAALWWANGFGNGYGRTFSGNTGRWDFGLFAYPAAESVIVPWHRTGGETLCTKPEDPTKPADPMMRLVDVPGLSDRGYRCAVLP